MATNFLMNLIKNTTQVFLEFNNIITLPIVRTKLPKTKVFTFLP